MKTRIVAVLAAAGLALATHAAVALAHSPHEVAPGEYLWKISEEHYGTGWYAWDLARWNNIQDPNLIFVGQVLEIPSVEELKASRPPVTTAAYAPAPAPAPAPRPAPAPAYTGGGDIVSIIHAAAARYGVDGNWMVRIAQCESGLNPNAVGGGGRYHGLFQFYMPTYNNTPPGRAGRSVYDPAANAEAAAWLMVNGGPQNWPVCAYR
ncbi:MAG TPA: LysM peptidoglycan-binding domain-containing protein [Dehalococcoidia bacterium]